MAISQPYVELFRGSYPDAAVTYPSPAYGVHPSANGACIFFLSSEDGSLTVEFMLADETWVNASAAATAVIADEMVIVEITVKPLAVRTQFTPTVGPATISIDAASKGVSQPT